jgi:hypothetical protein
MDSCAPISLHSMIISAIHNNISVVAASLQGAKRITENSTIDIWWGERRTSELMLLLAYFYSQSDKGRGLPIRLHAQRQHREHERTAAHLKEFLLEARIKAELCLHQVIDVEVIQHHLGQAHCTFLPMKTSGAQGSYLTDYLGSALDVPQFSDANVLFCMALEEIELDADQDVTTPMDTTSVRASDQTN